MWLNPDLYRLPPTARSTLQQRRHSSSPVNLKLALYRPRWKINPPKLRIISSNLPRGHLLKWPLVWRYRDDNDPESLWFTKKPAFQCDVRRQIELIMGLRSEFFIGGIPGAWFIPWTDKKSELTMREIPSMLRTAIVHRAGIVGTWTISFTTFAKELRVFSNTNERWLIGLFFTFQFRASRFGTIYFWWFAISILIWYVFHRNFD